MREVNKANKIYLILFCVPLILFAISFINSSSNATSDKQALSTNPHDIFKQDLTIVEDQYVVLNTPTSKNSFLTSSLSSNAYSSVINTDTARVKTGDIVSVYSTASSEHLGDFTISVKGDLNGDGEVNLNDVAKVYQYYKNRISLSRAAQIAGDVTNTGSISLGDVAKIYQFSKGKIGGL